MLFTRCPDCETTFRITAEALRKADGQVRCGRCARVFNAYNELRRRARKRNAPKRDDAAAASVEGSAPEPRASSAAADAAPPEPSSGAAGAEPAAAAAPGESRTAAAPGESSTAEAARSEPGEAQTARAEPAEAETARAEPVEGEAARAGQAEATAPHDADNVPTAPAAPAAPDADGALTAPAAPSDAAGPKAASSAAAAPPAELGEARADAGQAAPGPTARHAPPSAKSRPVPKAPAGQTDDTDKDVVVGDISLAGVIAELEASAEPDDAEPLDAAKPEVASSVPASVALLGKNGLSAAAAAPAGNGIGTDAAGGDTLAAPAWVILDETPAKPGVGARAWTYGAIAAGALLALQILHHYRSELAVTAVIGPAVRATYSMLGVEVMPDWDLDQYELVVDWDAVTQPDADEHGNLTIAARIRNRGPGDLPLPHVQVQLKDRWESTLGSRVFAPADYLPPDAAVHRSMIAGQIALAELAILDPGPQAYGFELDVCVGSEAGGLRCAADEVFR